MEKNLETIEQLKIEVKNAIAHDPVVKDCEKFNLKDIVIDSTMSIDNKQFSDNAIKKVLDILNVKPQFTEYRKSMSEKDWEMIGDRIKKAKGDVILYGEMSDQETVNNIHLMNPDKKRDDDMINSMAVVNLIENELRTSDCDYSLNSFNFQKDSYLFDIELKNASAPIDLLENDTWHTGHRFTFNSLNFKYMPFFERLVCSNGMYGKQFGFRSNIAKQSFNNERIERIINNALKGINETHYQLLDEQSKRLNNTNISLYEFYDHKNWFNRGSRKDAYELLMEKYFPEEPFFKTFGIPVNEQTSVWKRTADSGIKAYDFVNLLTWIASHQKETGLTLEDSIDLKIVASNLFFKQVFDLMQVAPRKTPDYPIFQIPVN